MNQHGYFEICIAKDEQNSYGRRQAGLVSNNRALNNQTIDDSSRSGRLLSDGYIRVNSRPIKNPENLLPGLGVLDSARAEYIYNPEFRTYLIKKIGSRGKPRFP